MYLRFTTQFINPYGKIETGIFMALIYLRDDYPLVTDDDLKKLKNLSGWFNANLEKPTRFSKGRSKLNADVSLSWFKDSAKEHILRIWDFIEIADRYNIVVESVTSKKPGYIVYEDDFQVSAVPFNIDRKRVI